MGVAGAVPCRAGHGPVVGVSQHGTDACGLDHTEPPPKPCVVRALLGLGSGLTPLGLLLPQVFAEIRNEHFTNVFGFLSQKARNLQAQYDVSATRGWPGTSP